MFDNIGSFLYLAGAGLLWVGALRVNAKHLYSQTRCTVLALSVGVTAIGLIGLAIMDMREHKSLGAIMHLLTGFSMAGAAMTFAFAARNKSQHA